MQRSATSRVLQQYGQQYLDRFATTMTAQQKKVLRGLSQRSVGDDSLSVCLLRSRAHGAAVVLQSALSSLPTRPRPSLARHADRAVVAVSLLPRDIQRAAGSPRRHVGSSARSLRGFDDVGSRVAQNGSHQRAACGSTPSRHLRRAVHVGTRPLVASTCSLRRRSGL